MTGQINFLFSAKAIDSNVEAPYYPAAIEDWAQGWERRLREDADQVDQEVNQLCTRIRALLDSLENKNKL